MEDLKDKIKGERGQEVERESNMWELRPQTNTKTGNNKIGNKSQK